MKWFGEHIWPFKSRMRNDVIVEKDSSVFMGTNEVLSQTGGNVTLANIDTIDATTISTLTSTLSGVNIDGLSPGSDIAQGDYFLYSDGGTEKKITFSLIEDEIFSNISSGATV